MSAFYYINRNRLLMYRVQLQNFEGPLDLLLFFIRRDELDIYDIPIAYITDQFISYLDFMEELDLGVASEFIYMASTLMSIKAKMMLPREKSDEVDFDESDPRYELVQSLLEYKRYKEIGEEMLSFDAEARRSYRRGYADTDIVEKAPDDEPLRDVTLFDLISAYRLILDKVVRDEIVHKIEKFNTSIEERSEYIIASLHGKSRMAFWELCSDARQRMTVIITFLAILEMVKDGKLALYIENDGHEFSVSLPTVKHVLNTSQ